MIDTISNIREWLEEGIYKNEEHAKVCIVLRILQKLGWNIWDPREVYTEFNPVKNEDSSRVDITLFCTSYSPPSVFIEVKTPGKIQTDLSRAERQLRDYNRNNAAEFSVITDGREWRLYYQLTTGEFSQRFFKSLDLVEDNIESILKLFELFLSKKEILNGNAAKEANNYLNLTRRQRAMEDTLPEAKRLSLEPPFQRLPEIFVSLLQDRGFKVSKEEVESFIVEASKRYTVENIIPTTTFESSKFHNLHILEVDSRTRIKRSSLPTAGTKCRFQYKDSIFWGEIKSGELVTQDHGKFSSLSSASAQITQTSRNGWRDWEFQLPGSNDWVLAQRWRETQR